MQTNKPTIVRGEEIIEYLVSIENEPITIGELAVELDISASRVSTLCTFLEAKGFLIKTRLGYLTFVEASSHGMYWIGADFNEADIHNPYGDIGEIPF